MALERVTLDSALTGARRLALTLTFGIKRRLAPTVLYSDN